MLAEGMHHFPLRREWTVAVVHCTLLLLSIQTEIHVTRLAWCDFGLWSPIENLYAQRVNYDQTFMETAISRAQAFYFVKYLPLVIPCMIITPLKNQCFLRSC